MTADIFDWRPQRAYNVVFFSFWLSHVPRQRFSAFWNLVRLCLAPEGRAFIIDNGAAPTPDSTGNDPFVVEYGLDLQFRRLSNGSEYRVVKVMYEPEELQLLLVAEGWDAKIAATRSFIFGEAQPR